MSWQTLILFTATCFLISATPGPNMLTALATGLRYGAGPAVWVGAGMCLALSLMAMLSALGLGALLAASAPAFLTVKWAGVAYLTWLGIQCWRAPAEPSGGHATGAAIADGGAGRLFRRGVLVAASNPKALVFMAALFPQFIEPTAPLGGQLVQLVAVMVVIEFGWIMTYAAGGDRLATRLTSPGAARWLNRMTGGLLIGAGGLLALVRHV